MASKLRHKRDRSTPSHVVEVRPPADAPPPRVASRIDAEKLDAACANGIELQLTGQLDLAGEIYASILHSAPDHAPANYCLGMLHIQSQRPADGLPYLKAALQAQVGVADYWLGYLEALLLTGQTNTARSILALARRQGIEGAAVEDFARRLSAQKVPPTNAGRVFLVAAPPYSHRSAGIRVLHTLCNELNLAGHTAHLVLFRFTAEGGVTFFTSSADADHCTQLDAIQRLPACNDMEKMRALIDDAFVIYPEVIRGNPLGAPRVVRYVLNKPESNGYSMLEGPHDFIVTFSRQFWKNAHWNAPLFIDEPQFHAQGTRTALERNLDCTYFGKGVDHGNCVKVPGSLYIDRNWPSDKEGLAALLRNTRYFFTWDVVTQTNIDALLCGAIPVVMRWAPFTPSIFKTEFGMLPYGEALLHDGTAEVTLDYADFDSQRHPFIASYRAAAAGLRQTIEELAGEVESYFARSESPALRSIAK